MATYGNGERIMITLLFFIISFAAVLGVIIALAHFAWRSRPEQKSAAAASPDFVAREAAQAAFMAGSPSQAVMLGMESALPYLSGLQLDAETISAAAK
jgi:heme/copper-type cytochrome/quinol oxidase subunit 2